MMGRIPLFFAALASLAVGCARQAHDAGRVGAERLEMTAYRTGAKFGERVEETDEHEDPTHYLVLVNDDFEEHNQHGPDHLDQKLSVPPGAGGDDDIGRLRLEPPTHLTRTGVLALELSNPSAVRLFLPDGTIVRNPRLDLRTGKGDLAGLTRGPVELWYEVLKPDPNFTFRYTWRRRGREVAPSDTIAACFAKWLWIGRDGQEITSRINIDKRALLKIADGTIAGEEAEPLLDAAVYTIRIEGLPSRAMSTLVVESNDVPGERAELEIIQSEVRTESKEYLVGYDSRVQPPQPLTPEERALVRDRLGLTAIHESP